MMCVLSGGFIYAVTRDPLFFLRIEMPDRPPGVASNDCMWGNTPVDDGVRTNNRIPTDHQRPNVTENRRSESDPTTFFDADRPPWRGSLELDRRFAVLELVIMIRHQHRRSEQRIPPNMDVILGGDHIASTDSTVVVEDNQRSTVTGLLRDIDPGIFCYNNIVTYADILRLGSIDSAGMAYRNALADFVERISITQPERMEFVEHAIYHF
jgi:hypothetical protein